MARKLTQLIMQKQGDVAVVSLLNKRMLDESNVRALYEELRFLVEERGHHRLVIDFGGVEYLTSAVLGKLVSLLKVVKKHGGRLRLCNLHPNVAEIFRLTELDRVIGIDRGISEAVEAVRLGERPRTGGRGWWPWRR